MLQDDQQNQLEELDELDYDSQRENSAIKRVKDEIKCVSPQNNRLASLSEFLRGNDEQKYGGFQQDEEDEEGSMRDYQNESSDGDQEEPHGLDLMVVGKAIKMHEPQRSSLIQAKETLNHQDGSRDEGSELDLYQLSEADGVSTRFNQYTAGKNRDKEGDSPKHLTSISKVGASLLDSQVRKDLMDLTASYQSIEEGRKSEIAPVQPFVTGSEK
jgi:hypothetical protein